ncbi:CBS-domain-containing protein [Rhizoclosmatium globosum]|uniref:CBS-domain-containing protein n=1 Tax=Rhizoclosmatium globosum TaxID=329046 RepID=A0A1Y2CWK2_9FUNG|nr:CBS-domain-containing protein [Rhizoclosmatium globosum]|eukprot:ORY51409.1 CBS-domain-containing protein [Rhizoclosmatium globosum]
MGPKKGTVESLRPSPAITVIESARIIQACQLMAAKKTDCVLAVNAHGQLSGILTDKDVAYRVVAAGLDVRSTTVAGAMTRDPVAVFASGPRNDALGVMVGRRFRHLPVISTDEDEDDDDDEDSDGGATNVVGVLDITKCVFDKLDDLAKKVQMYKACPVPMVSADADVVQAAQLMKDRHETGVVVVAEGPHGLVLQGILTTKDIVSRVVAAGLDPSDTAVGDVMTPNPKSAPPSTTILDALKMLYAGHYLHLPVTDGNTPVGLVDVLTLTMSMLDYMLNTENKDPNTTFNTAEASGPLWNQFWNSTWSTVDSESNAGSEAFSDEHPYAQPSRMSSVSSSYYTAQGGAGGTTGTRNSYMTAPSPYDRSQTSRQSIPAQVRSPQPHSSDFHANNPLANSFGSSGNGELPYRSQTLPSERDRTSHNLSLPSHQSLPPPPPTAASPTATSVYDDPTRIGIKLSDPKRGKLVRFTLMTPTTLADLRAIASGRLGVAPTSQDLRLSYEDDDGDWVLVSSDADLDDAISMARRLGEKLSLRVGDDVVLLNNRDVAPSAASAAASGNGGEEKASPTGSSASSSVLKDAPLRIVVVAAFVLSRLYRPPSYY